MSSPRRVEPGQALARCGACKAVSAVSTFGEATDDAFERVRGTTTTPSSSPTIASPGSTATPPRRWASRSVRARCACRNSASCRARKREARLQRSRRIAGKPVGDEGYDATIASPSWQGCRRSRPFRRSRPPPRRSRRRVRQADGAPRIARLSEGPVSQVSAQSDEAGAQKVDRLDVKSSAPRPSIASTRWPVCAFASAQRLTGEGRGNRRRTVNNGGSAIISSPSASRDASDLDYHIAPIFGW